MSSETEVLNLLHEYGRRIDSGDFAGVGQLLAHAACFFGGMPEPVIGADAITALYEHTTRRYDDGTPRTRHVITNPMVELDDESGTARVTSIYTVFQQVDDFPLQAIISGDYADRFERVDGAWRFAERHVGVALVGDLSHHLLIEL